LQGQPGSYHCSLPEIDRMVHISLQTEGVVGAQLAGAGLVFWPVPRTFWTGILPDL
jgi:hypothetical protein